MPDLDAGSLERLHDIAVPPPVPWWPPAAGWFVLGGIAVAGLGVWAWVALERWRRNRYRREAAAELERLPRDDEFVARVAKLLKRVALAAFPRERVASLAGAEWLGFLKSTGAPAGIDGAVGRLLGDGEYRRSARPADAELDELKTIAREWILHHRC